MEYMTRVEVAEFLRVNYRQIRIWERHNDFPAIRVGKKKILYCKKDVVKWLESFKK